MFNTSWTMLNNFEQIRTFNIIQFFKMFKNYCSIMFKETVLEHILNFVGLIIVLYSSTRQFWDTFFNFDELNIVQYSST